MKVRAFAFTSLFFVAVFLIWQFSFFGHISTETALNHINNVYDKVFSKNDPQPVTNPDLPEPVKETVVEEPWEPSPVEEIPAEPVEEKKDEVHEPWSVEETLPTPTPVEETPAQTIGAISLTPAESAATETRKPFPAETDKPTPVHEVNTLTPESVRIYIGIVITPCSELMEGNRMVEFWSTSNSSRNIHSLQNSRHGFSHHSLRPGSATTRGCWHKTISRMGARTIPRSTNPESDGKHERRQILRIFCGTGSVIPFQRSQGTAMGLCNEGR
jgi:hypothetical protein